MADWYRDHPHAGPASDEEYREWAQDNGLHVDAAGNVDYGPPEFESLDPDGYDRNGTFGGFTVISDAEGGL